MHSCQNNPEKSYTEKKSRHTASGYSLYTHCSFDAAKTILDCYRGKDCMENFCKDFREHAMRIVIYEKKKKWYCQLIKKISLMKSKIFAAYVKKN